MSVLKGKLDVKCAEWTTFDDLKLLNAISQCGFDNWKAIASNIGRSPKECEERYLDKFILKPEGELKNVLNSWEEIRSSKRLCLQNCNVSVNNSIEFCDYNKVLTKENFIKSLSTSQESHQMSNVDFMRYPHNEHRIQRKRKFNCGMLLPLSGHNPQRSDFEVEYDDRAEFILGLLHEPRDTITFEKESDNAFLDDIKGALASIYNFRLSERIRRKRIIRNHGLIDRRKTFTMLQKFEMPCGGKSLSILLKFMKFISGPEFDYLRESLKRQNELKILIQSYINYRSQGIRFLGGIKIYENLYKKRMKNKSRMRITMIQPHIDGMCLKARRSSVPLVLHNLPGYNLLEEGEKDLCSTARIIPETYYNFKLLLIAECKKHNGLRLVQARQLIKIDVNKTRKMFDYLLSIGSIWLPEEKSKS